MGKKGKKEGGSTGKPSLCSRRGGKDKRRTYADISQQNEEGKKKKKKRYEVGNGR